MYSWILKSGSRKDLLAKKGGPSEEFKPEAEKTPQRSLSASRCITSFLAFFGVKYPWKVLSWAYYFGRHALCEDVGIHSLMEIWVPFYSTSPLKSPPKEEFWIDESGRQLLLFLHVFVWFVFMFVFSAKFHRGMAHCILSLLELCYSFIYHLYAQDESSIHWWRSPPPNTHTFNLTSLFKVLRRTKPQPVVLGEAEHPGGRHDTEWNKRSNS